MLLCRQEFVTAERPSELGFHKSNRAILYPIIFTYMTRRGDAALKEAGKS